LTASSRYETSSLHTSGGLMSDIDFSKGDALDDFLGDVKSATDYAEFKTHTRTLPMDEASVRIRATVPEFTEKCPKCQGSGRFISYSGRAVGQCFACKGKGHKTFKTSTETRANAAQKRLDTKETRWADFAERNPLIAQWIIASAPRFDFAANMKLAVMTYGDLTEKQMAACQKGVVRDEEYRTRKSTQATVDAVAAPVQGYPNLKSAFDALLQKGVRKAQMTVGEINISLASLSGRNPGQIYVKDQGQYVGKIVNARFFPTRDASADLVARLIKIEADPRQAVIDHARMTAERIAAARLQGDTQYSLPCGCCGKDLTDPVSVNRGIGPVCAAKWDF
jgi:hypothetical protein